MSVHKKESSQLQSNDNLTAVERLYVIGRSKLLVWVVSSFPVVKYIQTFRNPILDVLFAFFTFLGDKYFYVTVVPCFFWIGDQKLGRLFTLHLIMNIYVGNFIKELLSLPRPNFEGVWRYKREYDPGLPSTHSMNSITVPVFLVGYLHQRGLLEITPMIVLAIALWTLCISTSRMYLGVHSPADVIGGWTIGLQITWLFLTYGENIDLFITQHPLLPISLTFIMILLVTIHPRSPISPSYSRSISIVGLAVGLVVGSWLHNQTSEPDFLVDLLSPYVSKFALTLRGTLSTWGPMDDELWAITVRLIVGFSMINIAFLVMQTFFLVFLRLILKIRVINSMVNAMKAFEAKFVFPSGSKFDEKMSTQQEEKLRKANTDFATIWSKFFALVGLSIVLVDTIPNLFTLIGI